MVAILNKDVMALQRITIDSEGDCVVMHFGNVTIKVPYETAFTLSQWIRVRAKEAKTRAGDTSRHWSLLGMLHDAGVTRG